MNVDMGLATKPNSCTWEAVVVFYSRRVAIDGAKNLQTSQYPRYFTSELSAHIMAFTPKSRFSTRRQEQSKATPEFKRLRRKLVKATGISAAQPKKHKRG